MEQFTLRELQMLAEAEFTVQQTRKDLNEIVRWCRSLDYHQQAIEAVSKERHLSIDILEKQKCFFIDDELPISDFPEEYKSDSFGFCRNNRFVMQGRFVYPVMDVNGDVMGFCGWDKYAKPKYLDSKNYGYKAKATTFYGMEALQEYYTNDRPVYLVEGIVCCLYLRMNKLQAVASLGSSLTPYVIQILKRFGSRLVVVPDNDAFGKDIERLHDLSGEHFVRQVKRTLPKAITCQSTVSKDIDDTRLFEDSRYELSLLKDLEAVAKNPWSQLTVLRVR